MTQLFHQLRTRSRALAHGLWLVLLATWLAAVCPHCLAQAEAAAAGVSGTTTASGIAMQCHDDAPAHAVPLTGAHDCCPQAPTCTGGDCAQLRAIEPGEPLSALLSESSAPVFAVAEYINVAYPSTSPPSAPHPRTVAFADCPLYLRHCTFLN